MSASFFFTECFYDITHAFIYLFVCTYLYKVYIEVSKMPEVHNSFETKKNLLPTSFPLTCVLILYFFVLFFLKKCSAFFGECVACCDEFKCLL